MHELVNFENTHTLIIKSSVNNNEKNLKFIFVIHMVDDYHVYIVSFFDAGDSYNVSYIYIYIYIY